MEDAKLPVLVVQQTTKATTMAPKPSAEHHSPRVAPLATRQQSSSPPPPQRAKPSRPPLDPPPTQRGNRTGACASRRGSRSLRRLRRRTAARRRPPAPAFPPRHWRRTQSYCGWCWSAARTVLGGRGGATPWRRWTPVDPIVFHLLELELPADESRLGPLRHRWNQKLLFHLAQELLAEADLLLGLDAPTTTAAMPSGGATLTTGATAAREGVEKGPELPVGGLPGGGRHRRAGAW
ncbi:unnamed protein product [Miscanthus lutarioriparius]|uniref:Uncharacterized protein n=1 Tax=Miscanthus lutarioriparius TaxID=422564 RepID=A0A811MW56_9POAL|nr:unnamed protein product [Miscanthus lutarioriparius]